MGQILRTTDDTPATTHYVVWHRAYRGPVSPPFATREAARAHLVEVYGGRPGLEVRCVDSQNSDNLPNPGYVGGQS